ncbi:protein-disulfide reductase DsbD family protein [Panacagrimonas sp.]|uniref:protein-disulfide reductase DsbD family protein n=1 Tax=Panacagrimonas sp. TaxID=2480088 RepID=UPI003B524140
MIFRLFLAIALSGASMMVRAVPVQTDHVEAELIAENLSAQGGTYDNWIALRLRPDPGWHVYWRNPGDSGIPTELEWRDLPSAVEVGALHWPYPHPHSLGDLTNYGYDRETLHLLPVRLGDASEFKLSAKAKWLVCKDICIPGEADLSLQLPLEAQPPQPDPAWAQAFAQAREEIPRAAPDWSATYAIEGGDFSLAVEGAAFPADARASFYAYANDLVSHAAPQRVSIDDRNGLRLSQTVSDYFVEAPADLAGVLVIEQGQEPAKAFELRAQPGDVVPVPAGPAPATAVVEGASPAGAADASLLAMLGFALLGGVILNLMPCVFPVLSIKALSVLRARSDDAAHRRRHALAYTAGVLATFVAIAGVLIGLRAGGAALGWGFQLQSPTFVLALTCVIFAMGLSLSGLVQFGTSWMGAGQHLVERSGWSGSFFTGVLAVVVASPCTAPFMAPALGFALAQPAASSLLVFIALGLGLALPFLLIGFVPRLAAWLPRPGAWMETFKQVMAFPLYLTAVWLLWVLGGLTDRHGMALGLLALVLVALVLWWSGRGPGVLGKATIAAMLLGLVALMAQVSALTGAPGPAQHTQAGWEPYSDARFDELRAQGRSVFVDFTADWCLTCKVNERGALRSAEVREAFQVHDVALLLGDWTRPDPAITAVLQRYGRSGVPLYLASRRGQAPQVLPQVLTPAVVSAAFEHDS